MININVKELNKGETKAGELDLSRFILPLSGKKALVKKLAVDRMKNTSVYQYCDKCNYNTSHLEVVEEEGTFITCRTCCNGYKIS